MRNRPFIYIVPKPFYWNDLVDLANNYKVDEELLLDFFKSIYSRTECSMLTYQEFNDYDAFERDEFLSILAYQLVEDYCEENDGDYAEYYEEFVNQVLWAKWFGKLLRTVNEEIETPRGTARKIKNRRRSLEIHYIEN